MGSAPGEGSREEEPAADLDLPYPFRISRFPITNAQFDVFAASGGYALAEYWHEARQEGFWRDKR